jgi:hypothetical protein
MEGRGALQGIDYTNVTQRPWLVKAPTVDWEFVGKYLAGEDVGIDTEVRRPPLKPIDQAGFPVSIKKSGSETLIYKMVQADAKKYGGVAFAPAQQGYPCQLIRSPRYEMTAYIGSVAPELGQYVMCETATGGFTNPYDLILQPLDPATAIYIATDVVAAQTLTDFDAGLLATLGRVKFWQVATNDFVDVTRIANGVVNPGALEISLFPDNQFRFGTALADGDNLTFYGTYGQTKKPYTVGKAMDDGVARVSATEATLCRIRLSA